MKTGKPAFIALTLALAFGLARAQAPAPATPAAREAGAEAAPKPPPNRKPIKRRSVQQIIEPTPRIVTEGYRPTLTARPPEAPGAAPSPAPPVRMNTCGAGGCFDSGGARFNGSGGVGNTLLSPKGQLCVQGPVNAQCF